MKKQTNSVSKSSVKSILSAAILYAMFSASGVNANNYPSVNLNNVSKNPKADPKTESGLIKGSEPSDSGSGQAIVKNEMTVIIEQWMEDSSYWSSDDSLMSHLMQSEISPKPDKKENSGEKTWISIAPYIFRAQSFIPESEF
jgi:hypothetical protein